MLGDVTEYENVPYLKIMVVSKFGACFTIGRLLLHFLFLTWELCNDVLLVVKGITRGCH